MLFKDDIDPELQPKRSKTLLISIAIHLVLLVVLILNPDFLSSPAKRIIRIAGQDYDLSKTQLTELTMPPTPNEPRPPAQESEPLVQPPMPEPPAPATQPPPPPPPPPPPQQQMPPAVISPEDVLAEGARPDAQPRASRGDTRETARAGEGGGPPEPQPPKPEPPAKPAETAREQSSQRSNPNGLLAPNLADSIGRVMNETIEEQRRRYMQGRTGLPGASATQDPNFSTEEPTILSDTRGYDFGPYMNQVVNRIRINWYSLIPEIARSPFNRQGRVVIIFTITENGTIRDLRVAANSGSDPLDRASIGSITASNPFPKLPPGFDGNHIVLQITYLYNYNSR